MKELYLKPIKHYKPDIVYVFRNKKDDSSSENEKPSTKDKDPFTKIADEIYASVKLPCKSVRDVLTETDDYKSVLAEIVDIRDKLHSDFGDDLDIFLNISSGTHEFAAAGAFASMAKKNIIAFSVDVKEYGIKECDLRTFFDNLSPKVRDPVRLETGDYAVPDEEEIAFLCILNQMQATDKYPKHSDIIDALKNKGVWTHNPRKKEGGRTPMEKREEMYLVRHYFDPAIEKGWIIDSKKKIVFTDRGRNIIDVYCRKEVLVDRHVCYNIAPMDIDMQEDIHDDRARLSFNFNSQKLTDIEHLHNEEYYFSGDGDASPVTPDRSDKEKVVEFERKGKKYRFRINSE